MTAARGALPTLALATTWQPAVVCPLHLAALITSTTWAGVLGLQKLVVHWIGTYTVPVFGLAAGLPGLPSSTTDPPTRPELA
jgi:hypothetical protein